MWTRFGCGGRRRRSAGVVLLFLIPMVGYHFVQAELQKREEWSGTVVRVYSERSFMSRRHSDHYWDVRTASGEVHSPLISTRSAWSEARVGDQVVKQAGSVNPTIVGRR